MKQVILALLTLLVVFGLVTSVNANDCTSYVDPTTGEIVLVCFGGGSSCGENCSPPPPPSCEPGVWTTTTEIVTNPAEPSECLVVTIIYDTCTQEIIGTSTDYDSPVECASNVDENPCDEFTWSGGGPTCTRYCDDNPGWSVTTSLALPELFLDVRPFPATLVRWDTAMRAGKVPIASSTGTLAYVPLGGGSADDPAVGDWSDVSLSLRFVPSLSGLMVELPHIGSVMLPASGESGQPYIFHWEKPSHPEVGGNVLAGNVPGFDELPADMPVYQGQGGTTYRLFYSFQYDEYTRHCRPGPSGDGAYECKTSGRSTEKDGHYVYRWRHRSETQEIPPSVVQGLPAGMAVDMNGDGVPDAYWNSNLTVRRMDENNSVYNPRWERSWNWGGAIYWGVREGQGEIGWPGTP